MTATMTKLMVHAHWHIVEDFPPKDGEYVVCFLTDEGEYGWPDIWSFEKGEWSPCLGLNHGDHPTHWCNLPMPK